MNNDSSWTGRHDSLDRAIDRAVRDMMQVDPPLGLRRRVLSRIGSDTSARAPFVLRFAWGAGALALVIAAVIFTSRRSIEPTSVPTVASEAATAPAPAPHPVAPSVPPSPSTPRDKPSRATREPIPMPRVGNVFGAPRGAAAANAPAESVWTAPSSAPAPDAAALPPLEIRPLSAAPIEMPPIVVPPLQPATPKGGQQR